MSSWRKCSLIALAATFVVQWVEARPHRVHLIPNGPVNRCGTCHVNPNGGGTRNPFGQMVEASFLEGDEYDNDIVLWGPELANMDADGDGFTNGEELGDPQGIWVRGDDHPGDPEAVTLPGIPASHPPEEVNTAVESSTWGQIKALAQLLF